MCQVHALNNLEGQPILHPMALKEFCDAQRNAASSTGERAAWEAAFNQTLGFSDSAIEAWLHKVYNKQFVKVLCSTEQGRNTPLISHLSDLSLHHACNAFLCRRDSASTSGHSFVLKRRASSNTWYELDSLRPSPTIINSERNLSSLGNSFTLHMLEGIDTTEHMVHHSPHLAAIYMERQEKQFCLVHALNMALGLHLITGAAALRHMNRLEDILCIRLAQIESERGELPTSRPSLNSFYSQRWGNFNVDAIYHFLHHFDWTSRQLASRHLTYTTNFLGEGSINPQLLSTILPSTGCTDAPILSSRNGLG